MLLLFTFFRPFVAIVCIFKVEILHNGVPQQIFNQLGVHLFDDLLLAMVGVNVVCTHTQHEY